MEMFAASMWETPIGVETTILRLSSVTKCVVPVQVDVLAMTATVEMTLIVNTV